MTTGMGEIPHQVALPPRDGVGRIGIGRIVTALALTAAMVLTAGAFTGPVHAAEQTQVYSDGATVSYDDELAQGRSIRISGTNWLAQPDRVQPGQEGSVVGFKLLDAAGTEIVRKEPLSNPRTGAEVNTVWGIVWADSEGGFEIDMPWPDATTATHDPGWTTGTTFQIQLLSGQLYDGGTSNPNQRPDVSRTMSITVTVGAADPIDPEDQEAPRLTREPIDVTAATNANAVFTSAAVGVPAATVQWQRSTNLSATNVPTNWISVNGATEPTLVVTAGTSPHLNNRWYRVVYTNDAGRVESQPVKLSVAPMPTVATQPAGQTIQDGATATFTATAGAGDDITVQWQKATAQANGDADDATWTPVDGATSDTLQVVGNDPSTQDGTFYRAVFTNASGSVNSQPAQLRFYSRLDSSAPVTVTGQSYGPSGTQPTEFSVSAPNAMVAGEPIVITGTGYVHPDGSQGSAMTFMIDASYSGDPNTLNTTRDVINPVTGQVFSDKRSHAVVQANPDGTWQATIPWPDETNTTRDAAFFESNWAEGTQHAVRILSGSLLDGDYQRGISVRFTVLDESTDQPAFNDVPSNHVFLNEINWLASTGITTGYTNSDGTVSFRPSQPVLREQMAAFLYRLAGSPEVDNLPTTSPFTDVATSHTFYREIVWLARTGITTGYDNGNGTVSFRPSEPVLREQMAAFLYRFDEQDYVDGDGAMFTDVPTTHVFFDEIEWLASTGITTGYVDGTYRGSQPVLREQMAAFLFRYSNLGE